MPLAPAAAADVAEQRSVRRPESFMTPMQFDVLADWAAGVHDAGPARHLIAVLNKEDVERQVQVLAKASVFHSAAAGPLQGRTWALYGRCTHP
jgi:hypothetical protein